MEIAGKRVLLTGAAGGLGETAAKALAARGATLVLSSRNREKLDQIAAELDGHGHEVITADLSNGDEATELVRQAGHIDILIANAGRSGGFALDELPPEEVSDVIKVNFEVPIQMARAVTPQMTERGAGQIVLIASLAGKFALPESTMYSSTKSGLRAFGWALRAELGRRNVGVTVISPGFISEVGMFAKRGRKAPPGAGTISPQRYVKALIHAIENNKGEVVIAPPQLRVLGQLSLIAPGFFARVFKRAAPQRKAAE
ncbi:MAG: SDR family NAD(P)-dependent oxidoreductase [Solirubrobacterales bacterium]